jgi:hypothetical protein
MLEKEKVDCVSTLPVLCLLQMMEQLMIVSRPPALWPVRMNALLSTMPMPSIDI